TVRAVSGLDDVPAADAIALDAECQVRAKTDTLPGAGRVGGVSVVADERPLGGGTAVVEGRLADELDLDLSLDALDRSDEHVVAVIVRRRPRVRCDPVLTLARPHRQRVSYDDPARRRLPRRHQHVCAGLVAARCGMADAEGPDPEEPGAAIEQA